MAASRSIVATLPTYFGASATQRGGFRFSAGEVELIRLRIAEKQRHLIPLGEAVGHMDEVVGLFISHLSGFARSARSWPKQGTCEPSRRTMSR